MPVDPKRLIGRECYAGLDLSSTTDITAFVLIFQPEYEGDKYVVLPYFWIPEENIRQRVDRDRVPYEEIYRLRELKQEVMMKNVAREGLRQRIVEMTKYLKEQPQQLETYDDLLVRQLIERVTIHKRNLTIEFKSGIEKEIAI